MTNVALVIGSTGLVGEILTECLAKPSTPGGPWKIYGVARRPKIEWHIPTAYIQCDLVDRADTLGKLSPLTDVTHLFWVTAAMRGTFTDKETQCALNASMFRNALDAILPNAKGLRHICLQTGRSHYEVASDIDDNAPLPDHPYQEDVPRLPGPNFYYALEDILHDAVKQKQGELTWSVHRPTIMFGSSPRSQTNFMATIAVYGSICKFEGLPFIFPGAQGAAWDSLHDGANADLVAEQQIWAATDPNVQNQAFNCTNGDLFTWKSLWRVLAAKFGLEALPPTYPPFRLQELMSDKQTVWDKIVKEHGLQPYNIQQLCQFSAVGNELSIDGTKLVVSTNKSKELGFLSFRNTEKTFHMYIDRMRDHKIIP